MEPTIKSTLDTKTLVLCALIIIGLVLTFVGLFGDFLKEIDDASSRSVTLSQIIKAMNDEDIKEDYSISPQWAYTTDAFAWCTFAFSIASVISVIAITFYKISNGKGIVGFCVFFNLIFAILVFVFSFKMAKELGANLAYGPLLTLFGSLLVSVSCLFVINGQTDLSFDGATLLLCVILLTGFVLATVGLSVQYMKVTENKETTSLSIPTLSAFSQQLKQNYDEKYKYFNEDYPSKVEGFSLVHAFTWIGFALSFLCVLLMVAVKLFGASKYASSSALLGLLTVVVSILILALSIAMVNKNNANKYWIEEKMFSTLGAGPILMMIGGILAGGSEIRLGKTQRKPLLVAPTGIDQTDKTLQKMKDLVDAGILPEKQYEEKKQEIAKQKERTLSDNDIDANIKKLKDLVDAGFLSEEDYEKKRNELEDQKRNNRAYVIRDENIKKLKELYEAGILSTEDYEKKKKEVEEKNRQKSIEYMTLDEMIDYLKEQKSLVDKGRLSKDVFEKMRTDLKPLKKLRGMVDSGIITQEEYEAKKKEITEIYEE